MKTLIPTLALVISISCFGQTPVTTYKVPLIDKDAPASGSTITRGDVAKMPSKPKVSGLFGTYDAQYPGGVSALQCFLSNHFHYPDRVP